MQTPLQDFDFSILDDSRFKEDGVREEIITPLLWGLGYSASGTNRIVRSQRLEHPYVSIGTSKQRISLVPDYLMLVDEKPAWILDAKSPQEKVDDPDHLAQAYSYAIHRDVRVQWYAVCNGREFAAFNVADMGSAPRLRVLLPDLKKQWSDLVGTLSPMVLRSAGKQFAKDLGIHFLKMRVRRSTTIHFLNVPVHMVARVKKELFLLHINAKTDEGEYAASFDFDRQRLGQLLGTLPSSIAESLSKALAHRAPSVAGLEGIVSTVNIEARLEKKIQENDQEHYLPFWVESFSKGQDRKPFPS